MWRYLILSAVLVLLVANPSPGAEVDFSGHYRVRAFSVEGIDRTNNNGLERPNYDEQWSFVDHRFRLSIDIKQGDLMGRLQINSGNYVWGESQDLPDDEWHREMFIKFPFGPATVKVGRQWAATPFKSILYQGVLDTLLLLYPLTPEWTLIGAALNADDTGGLDVDVFTLIGLYKPAGSPISGAIGWYYLTGDTGTTDVRPMWLAGTLDYVNGPLKASLTGAYEFGDLDTATRSYDYKAYAIDVRAGYDFGVAGGPPLSVEAIIGYGTGDDDANDDNLENFTSPLPSYTHTAIFLDHGDGAEGGAQLRHPARSSGNVAALTSTTGATQPDGLGNLKWFGLKADYKVSDKASIKGLVASYYLAEENVTGGTSYKDDRLGEEINIALVYNILQDLDLTISGAWFFPNEDGWTETTATTKASDDTVSEYMAKIFWGF